MEQRPLKANVNPKTLILSWPLLSGWGGKIQAEGLLKHPLSCFHIPLNPILASTSCPARVELTMEDATVGEVLRRMPT